MKRTKRLFWFIPLALVSSIVGFILWATIIPAPMPEAIATLQSDSNVTVSTNDPWLVFTPTSKNLKTGLVIYPGGRVDPRAYAPLAREIALAGYQAVIVPMPLNLAVLAPNRAVEVTNYYENIKFRQSLVIRLVGQWQPTC